MTQLMIQDAAAGRAEIIGLTVQLYDYLIEHKLLEDDTSTELLDGLIVKKDRAAAGSDPHVIGDRHALVVNRLTRLVPQFDPFGCYLQIQQPIRLPPWNEPDASVIRGSIDDAIGKPGAAGVLCVIEVADSSLGRDLGAKLTAYASSGVPQYVVFDLTHDVVIDHREPRDGRYSVVKELRGSDLLKLLTATGMTVDVPISRLLP